MQSKKIQIYFIVLFILLTIGSRFFSGWYSAVLSGLFVIAAVVLIIRTINTSLKFYKQVYGIVTQKLGGSYSYTITADANPVFKDKFLEQSVVYNVLSYAMNGMDVTAYQIVEDHGKDNSITYHCIEFPIAHEHGDVQILFKEFIALLCEKNVVKTESDEFNKKFVVESSDGESAFEIVSPDVMVRMIDPSFPNAQNLTGLRKIMFKDKMFGIAVVTDEYSENVFEPIMNSVGQAAQARIDYYIRFTQHAIDLAKTLEVS